MPTRLVTGLSYIRPTANTSNYIFTSGDTTPDVSLGTVFFTANSGITLTGFDGGELGKVIYIYSRSASVTTINTGGNIVLSPFISTSTDTGVVSATEKNLVMSSGGLYHFLCISTSKWVQLDGNRTI